MSNIYHTEPPTQGKVLLKTSSGDIDIELWPKEAPLACRNFVQLCLEGYYDNTSIHRIIKEFMIQMGDPTGTGEGGESIWGKPFKDEIHGRIKFNHRGQVAMANSNKPNTNQSQFFITLGPCSWIDRKHTIFGKVTGNTIYNVLKMGEVEIDSTTDRPVENIMIIKTEVLWNPFDDIIPRDIKRKKTSDNATIIKSDDSHKKKQIKSTKNKQLLSFENDDDDDMQDSFYPISKEKKSSQGKSMTDIEKADKPANTKSTTTATTTASSSSSTTPSTTILALEKLKQSVNKKIIPITASTSDSSNSGSSSGNNNNNTSKDQIHLKEEVDFEERMRQQMIEKRRAAEYRNREKSDDDDEDDHDDDTIHHKRQTTTSTIKNSSISSNSNKTSNHATTKTTTDVSINDIIQDAEIEDQNTKVSTKLAEYNRLREELLQSKRAIKVLTGQDAALFDQTKTKNEVTSIVEQRRQKYIKRKHEYGDRQEETLKKLMKFTATIQQEKQHITTTTTTTTTSTKNHNTNNSDINADMYNDKRQNESYHGQILEKNENEDSDDEDDNEELGGSKKSINPWHSGKLKFVKHIDDKYRLGNTSNNIDDYMVIDSRKNNKK